MATDVTDTGWGLLVVRGEALGSWGFECSVGEQKHLGVIWKGFW